MDKPREHGAIFRGHQIRALLAGEMSEVRWPIKPRPTIFPKGTPTWYPSPDEKQAKAYDGPEHFAMGAPIDFARWRPGDRLWCRETWHVRGLCWSMSIQASRAAAPGSFVYRATPPEGWAGGWRPSLLMPRWACRITLPVLTVRAERLTAITDAGAVAEGFVHAGLGSTAADYCREYRKMHGLAEDADPWVWVIGFGPAEVTNG